MKETYYMHKESGDVATESEWHSDMMNMDVDSWFGKDATDDDYDNWQECGHLVEVVKSNGEWVEV